LENPAKEIQKIIKVIELAIENTEKPQKVLEPFIQAMDIIEKSVEVKPEAAVFPEYKAYELEAVGLEAEEFYAQSQIRRICGQITTVIEHEGPISRQLLCKRVLAAWGITRTGTRIDRYFTELLSKIPSIKTKAEEMDFYWPLASTPALHDRFRIAKQESERRNAEDLPVEEAASAVKYVLSVQISLPKLDLIKEVAKLLGYQRNGAALDKVIKTGIDEAVKRGFVRLDELDRVIYRG
jgi:hypothetical protein